MRSLVLLALGWLAYAALHSLLADLRVKAWVARRWPRYAPAYRLGYNLLAVLLALPLAWATWALPGDWLWRWAGMGAWLANGLALAGLALFAAAGPLYDMGEFLGSRPLCEGRSTVTEHEGLRLSALHRHVRHPWYALGLLLLWTRDMNAPMLVSALAVTAYFVLGSRLEERKLEAHFGTAYGDYRQRVPGLLPLPWRQITAAEAEAYARRAQASVTATAMPAAALGIPDQDAVARTPGREAP